MMNIQKIDRACEIDKACGFSLVELSIVLVILGLLTGGILAGQNLIRASELRAVTTEYDRYIASVHTFRDKYFALPGDMQNATAFWGKDNTNCSGHTGSAATPGTCNGGGNGRVGSTAVSGEIYENHRFWQHLALAGLIEGSYSGMAGAGGVRHVVPGVNAPKSKLGNAGWSSVYHIAWGGNPVLTGQTDDYGHVFVFGNELAASESWEKVISPEEAWNIDTKMDDGKPHQGKVWGNHWDDCTLAASATDVTSEYALTNTAKDCSLLFKGAY